MRGDTRIESIELMGRDMRTGDTKPDIGVATFADGMSVEWYDNTTGHVLVNALTGRAFRSPKRDTAIRHALARCGYTTTF